MSGEQRKRKCPIKRGQKIGTRDVSTSAFGLPRTSRAPTESSVTADLSSDSDGNSNPSFPTLDHRSVAALYNRMNANRSASSQNRHQYPSDNRQQLNSETRPNVDSRRIQSTDSRRSTAPEQPRHAAAENRRPSASGNRRPATSENRRSAASENRPPAVSENRRPPQVESRRQAAFDGGLPSPPEYRRQSHSDNRRSNPSESRRPTRPAPVDMQNNASDNGRQPPVVQAPVPVRLPLQPRGQIPQAPRPPPAPTPVTDYQALMNIFQGLSLLDRTVRKVRSNTGEFLNLLSSHVTVDSMGNFRRLEPAAIALYVVTTDETGKCCNCNRDASTVCGKCRAACYCSSFCLQRDWGSHEVHCNLETLTFVQATAQQRLRI